MARFGRVPKRSALGLMEHETRVLQLLTQGMSNKQIGFWLGVEESTVKQYLHLIFQKLDVKNRTQAAIRYLQSIGPVEGQ